jgi:DMSO reductase anchor subunit
MHPALSVIVFTVSSGAGLGLIVLSVLFGVFQIGGGLTPVETLWGGGLGLLLTTIGLLSSTFHLANPKNAWRAVSRFRSSWLSREGVFAILLYPIALLYFGFAGLQSSPTGWLVDALGILTALLALATIFSTGMIYACLRTMRQWNTSLVPTNYILMGLALGGMLLTTVLTVSQGPARGAATTVTLIALIAAGLGKLVYYFWIGAPKGPSINTATGFSRGAVRLFESGQSSSAFLDKEFGFRPPASLVARLRLAVYGLGFLLPIILVSLLLRGQDGLLLALIASLSAFLGIAVERWLFFAEARHVVNLFYGAQRT